MASNQRHNDGRGGGKDARARAPEWADGLKQLYDSVVEEDLPDSFKDLLSRLDAVDRERGPNAAGSSSDGRNNSQ